MGLAALAITVLNWLSPPQFRETRLMPPHLSIVVLAFTNLSDDHEQQYFADGVAEDLTTDLSRVGQMFVISRNTAFTYRDKPVDTRQIGRELGVRYVLEGSVQRSGGQLRVSAQLSDAENAANLWAERLDSDTGDLFAVQNEITRRIAVALNLEVIGAEAARPSEHPDALDYILRGRALLMKPPTRDNRAEAIVLFDRALALDPLSVVAQSWLARTLAVREPDEMTSSVAADVARAEELVAKALAAAPAALCQRHGSACAGPLRRSHSRIRDSDRVRPQLAGRIRPSRPMQILHGVAGGIYPASGAKPSDSAPTIP
jgi:TolB-like protein